MFEIVKTVFLLSCIGTGITLILLLIKPFTVRKLSAKWQYFAWILVILFMIIPVWKMIPEKEVKNFTPYFSKVQTETTEQNISKPQTIVIEDVPMEYRQVTIQSKSIRIYDLISYTWAFGVCLFLAFAFGSYFIFLIRKKKNSIDLEENIIFEEIKKELNIKRKIRIRISNDAASPMLVGVFFPVIYMSKKAISQESQKMIYRHELTHYKHKDLIFKWFSLVVNAIHWFNPFAYLVSANISEACEVACDMSVIKDMTEQEQKAYMNTILDLVKNKKGRE